MTEIEKKALALVNEVILEVSSNTLVRLDPYNPAHEALRRAIEQHEAFRQEVSDAVERAIEDCGHDGLRKAYIHGRFSRFIFPKPDPLVEALNAVNPDVSHGEGDAELFREALAKHGLQVTEIEP